MMNSTTAPSASSAFKAYDRIDSVADIVDHQLLTYGHRTAIRFDNGQLYDELSFLEYHARIAQMIRYLQAEGAVQKVIATFCKNRLEWDMTAMAAFYTANIICPLDTKFNSVELEHVLGLSRPDYALVARAQLERFRAIAAKL